MKKHRMNNKSLNQQRGISVVLLAIMAVVIFGLLGLVVTMSSLFSSHSRQQNNSNLTAYAAIEAFMRDEIPNTLTDRISRARIAADTILAKNQLFFFSGTYNPSTVWNGPYVTDTTQLQFGVWFDTAPTTCPLPAVSKTDELTGCDCVNFSLEAIEGKPFKNAPCFIPYTESEMGAAKTPPNSVRALVKTPGNSITAPFASMIAKGVSNKTQVNAAAIAATVERCTVFLVDVSNSSFGMSHNYYYLNQEWVDPITYQPATGTYTLDPKFNDPSKIPGNYAILAPTTNPYSMYICSLAALSALSLPYTLPVGSTAPWGLADASLYWCAMEAVRPPGCTDPDNISPPCAKHYRSDYEVEDTVDGILAIDKFRKPQPLDSIFVAVNSSLRGLAAKATTMDKIAILPFSDKIHAPVPPTGLSRDLDLMIDLTDMRRAGKRVYNVSTGLWETVNEEHPNYIDRGWSPVGIPEFAMPEPIRPKKATDLLGALNEGIKRLSDVAFCGQRARKTLVLASDGIMNMYYPTSPTPVNWAAPTEIKQKNDLKQAQDLLYADMSLSDNILKRLIDNDIHFLPMLVGGAVDPNFANVLKPTTPITPSSIRDCYANLSSAPGLLDTYYSIPELAANGYRGLPNSSAVPPEYSITNNINTIPPWPLGISLPRPCRISTPDYDHDVCTIRNLKFLPDATQFRRPNGWLSQLAILSQGYYCPITEPYRTTPNGPVNASCYDTSCEMYAPFTSDPTLCDETKSRTWKSGSPTQCDRTLPFQNKSTYGDEMGGQAAHCLRIALGAPPYYLATEEPF